MRDVAGAEFSSPGEWRHVRCMLSAQVEIQSSAVRKLIMGAQISASTPHPGWMSRSRRGFATAIVLWAALASQSVSQMVKPILLVDVDHRKSLSLNGDWHA